MHIYLLLNGGISDLHLDLFTIRFLCLLRQIFFPRIPVAVFGVGVGGWGVLRDKKKKGKKSPLVSAPQIHHLEPSCHPPWIKSPSLVAAGLLTWCLTLSCGVEGGGGRSRG